MRTLAKRLESHASMTRLRAAGFVALIVAAAIVASPVSASHLVSLPDSDFEIDDDANLSVEHLTYDWDNVPFASQNDDPSGSGDNSFGQGSKENTAVPAAVTGSIPPNKSDVTKFGLYSEENDDGQFLHLFWTRVQDPSGTTNMDFEFNQSTTISANLVTPVRTDGDLLVTYDLSKGGTVPVLSLRKWDDAAGEWGAPVDLTGSGDATGSINLSPIGGGNPAGLGALDPRTFGEASIDLDAIFTEPVCTTFGSAYLKSRSSDSFTSALKDFITPLTINISNCGSITIKKVTDPGENTPTTLFDFTHDIVTIPPQGSTGFSLKHDETKLFSNVVVGAAYTVTETVPTTGWDLTLIGCTGATSSIIVIGAAGGFDSGDEAVTITLAADEDIVYTFTNRERGSITIVKDTVPDDGTDFAFTAVGLSGFSLDDDGDPALSNTEVFDNLAPGTYSVTETGVGGYVLSDIACSGETTTTFEISGAVTNGAFEAGDNKVEFELAEGEDVTCTFMNTKDGSITIVKDADPDGETDFDFTTIGVAGLSFLLDDDGNGSLSNTRVIGSLQPGPYEVAELAEDGFVLTNIVCTGKTDSTVTIGASGAFVAGDTDVEIVLAAGENITCTFTNTEDGSLTIVKDALPNGDTEFSFTTTGLSPTSFILDDNADGALSHMKAFENLQPATYEVSEDGESGFVLTSIDCTGHTDSVVTIGASGDFKAGDTKVTVDLAAGEHVTCTFTNTEDGSITIVKEAVPASGIDFGFTTTKLGGAAFNLDDDADPTLDDEIQFLALQPDTYTIEEIESGGYVLTNIVCAGAILSTVTIGGADGFADGDTSVQIGLAAGEHVTCTFTNTSPHKVIILVCHTATGTLAPSAVSDAVSGEVIGETIGSGAVSSELKVDLCAIAGFSPFGDDEEAGVDIAVSSNGHP